MKKLPSFQFYPGDWLKDPSLRVCSVFARGLLVDLLCVMHESRRRGVLCYPDGTTPLTDQQVVSMVCGSNEADKLAALAELEAHSVLKRDEHGCLYSARMVRDEEIRSFRATAGHLGGSKHLSKAEANTQAKREQTAKQKVPPSSSSSSSSSDVNTESASALSSARPTSLIEVTTYGREIGLPPQECERYFDHFTANGWKQGGRAAMKDWRAALRNWKRRAGEFGGNGGGHSPPAASTSEIDWEAKGRRMARMANTEDTQ